MKGISIDKIPKKGLVMAYFRNQLLFLPYEVAGDELKMPGGAFFDKEMPYECHFFNKDMEYRLIRRESRNDVIERILTKDEEEKMESDLLFPEEVLVKKEYTDIPGIPEKLRVINRYHYSENDTLVLKDYRIAAP